MFSRFNDLCASAANDGASCPVGAYRDKDAEVELDLDDLLDAWYRERTGRIESSLVLDQARRLIVGMLASGDLRLKTRRRAKRLLRSIREIQDGNETLDDRAF